MCKIITKSKPLVCYQPFEGFMSHTSTQEEQFTQDHFAQLKIKILKKIKAIGQSFASYHPDKLNDINDQCIRLNNLIETFEHIISINVDIKPEEKQMLILFKKKLHYYMNAIVVCQTSLKTSISTSNKLRHKQASKEKKYMNEINLGFQRIIKLKELREYSSISSQLNDMLKGIAIQDYHSLLLFAELFHFLTNTTLQIETPFVESIIDIALALKEKIMQSKVHFSSFHLAYKLSFILPKLNQSLLNIEEVIRKFTLVLKSCRIGSFKEYFQIIHDTEAHLAKNTQHYLSILKPLIESKQFTDVLASITAYNLNELEEFLLLSKIITLLTSHDCEIYVTLLLQEKKESLTYDKLISLIIYLIKEFNEHNAIQTRDELNSMAQILSICSAEIITDDSITCKTAHYHLQNYRQLLEKIDEKIKFEEEKATAERISKQLIEETHIKIAYIKQTVKLAKISSEAPRLKLKQPSPQDITFFTPKKIAVKSDPFERGFLLYKEHQYEDAIDYYTKILQKYKNVTLKIKLMIAIGDCHLAIKAKEAALATYQQAHDLLNKEILNEHKSLSLKSELQAWLEICNYSISQLSPAKKTLLDCETHEKREFKISLQQSEIKLATNKSEPVLKYSSLKEPIILKCKIDLNENTMSACKLIKASGYEVYIVGGKARDHLINFAAKDVDIVTNASPDNLCEIFSHFNPTIIGKTFLIVLINFYGEVFEISTFRDYTIKATDIYPYGSNPSTDYCKRDFTVNALYYNVFEQELYDYSTGLIDIKNKKIKTIGNTADSFLEDAIRMLRAIYFSAKLNFDLSIEIQNQLCQLRDTIRLVNQDRLIHVFLKMLTSGCAQRIFKSLLAYGYFQLFFAITKDMTATGEVTIVEKLCTYLDSKEVCNNADKILFFSVVTILSLESEILSLLKTKVTDSDINDLISAQQATCLVPFPRALRSSIFTLIKIYITQIFTPDLTQETAAQYYAAKIGDGSMTYSCYAEGYHLIANMADYIGKYFANRLDDHTVDLRIP